MGLNTVIFGVRLWIWVYFFASTLMASGSFLYFYREWLRLKYYEFRFPEKLVKCIIHYKSGLYRVYWRVVPDDKQFMIDSKNYHYSDKNVLKENDFYAIKDKTEFPIVTIKKKKYYLNELYAIKLRKHKYMELHYWFNSPSPINFNFDKKNIDFNSSQLQSFKDNDLFAKLLTLETEKKMIALMMLGILANLGVSLFILAKIMEWL